MLFLVFAVEESPKHNHSYHEIKLPPKKAVVQNLNGLMKTVQPKATAHLQPGAIAAVNNATKIPVFPIGVSLPGQSANHTLAMLGPITPQGGALDISMAGKLMEIQQKIRPPVTQILHQTLTQRQALLKKTNTAPSIGIVSFETVFCQVFLYS